MLYKSFLKIESGNTNTGFEYQKQTNKQTTYV